DFHVTGVQTCALPIFDVVGTVQGGGQRTTTVSVQRDRLQHRYRSTLVGDPHDEKTHGSTSASNAAVGSPALRDRCWWWNARICKIGRASCREGVQSAE